MLIRIIMGYPLMFYVAEDIREQLKAESNRSELINDLLRKHYEFKKSPTMSLEQMKELREILIKQKELEEEAKKISNG